jgi:hypothetical protein
MDQFIEQIVVFLVNELSSGSQLIRSTTLWTLSKFAGWISANLSGPNFSQYMSELTKQLQESDPNIQESAC